MLYRDCQVSRMVEFIEPRVAKLLVGYQQIIIVRIDTSQDIKVESI